MTTHEMDSKVRELRELRRMADELAAEMTAIQDELKAAMTAAGTYEYIGMDWRITWNTVTSSRLDTTALKKALPDLVAQFTKETTTRRFCVA